MNIFTYVMLSYNISFFLLPLFYFPYCQAIDMPPDEAYMFTLAADYFTMLSRFPIAQGLQYEDRRNRMVLLLIENDIQTQVRVETYLSIINLPYKIVHGVNTND